MTGLKLLRKQLSGFWKIGHRHMYICYGISNGPYYRRPREIWESEDPLWHAPIGGVVVQEQDDLVLTVPEFDSTKSAPVKITLSRKGSDMPLVEIMANSYQLNGKPELIWGRRSP